MAELISSKSQHPQTSGAGIKDSKLVCCWIPNLRYCLDSNWNCCRWVRLGKRRAVFSHPPFSWSRKAPFFFLHNLILKSLQLSLPLSVLGSHWFNKLPALFKHPGAARWVGRDSLQGNGRFASFYHLYLWDIMWKEFIVLKCWKSPIVWLNKGTQGQMASDFTLKHWKITSFSWFWGKAPKSSPITTCRQIHRGWSK